MKKVQLFLLTFILPLASLFAQDTVVVQTLTYDSTARVGVWEFPSDTNSWRKIVMQYSMRCHDNLVGNGNVGCYEWDYSCNTVITDSSRTDSIKRTAPSHLISNFSGNPFDLTNAATYSFFDYIQHNVTYGSTISETPYGILGSAPAPQSYPFGTANPQGRSQFMWTATELSGQGLTAGDITSLRLNLASLGTAANFLRIKIKGTSASLLDANNPELSGFSEVYFSNTTFPATGWQQFNFYTPFTWNGTDNLIVELSYRNAATGTNNQVNCVASGADLGLVTNSADKYMEFSGAENVIVDPAPYSNITNEITVSFWAWGGSNLPINNSVFEGSNAGGARHANVHLPWSDGTVYWDCGGDAGGYDRINLAASANDYKGRWTHWAFTKNANTGDMKIWKDGVLFHSGTGKTKPIDIRNFRIGSNVNGGNGYSGKLNEFQVFNAALDGPTIAAWMHRDLNPSHPNYANLIGYYKMDEGSGTTVIDASSFATASAISGAGIWGDVDAAALYRNFSITQNRPQVYFVRGSYASTNDVTTTVRDAVLNPQKRVVAYTVTSNNLVPVDTNFYFQAGWQYVYDAQTGQAIDSILAATDSSIVITTLNYYRKWPSRYEIMSFVTPYGNGLSLGPDGVMWEFDLTDFAPILKDRKRLSMEFGGQFQEEIDIRFLFIRGTPPRDVIDIQPIWPMNTSDQIYGAFPMPDIYNEVVFEPRKIRLDPNSAAWKIRSSITGHGQNGEFIARWHYFNINGGIQELRWRVWKECSDMPVYPQGGTWLYDRAGWCPGVPTDLQEYEVGSQGIAGDSLELDYGMDVISNTSASDYRIANQFVTYGAPNFSLDASLTDIKRPSNNVRYRRFNPACNQPVVLLRNEGSTTLDSVDIIYNQQGGPTRTYRWRGTLQFLESTEVTLPLDNPTFWTGTAPVFEARINAPNGGQDMQPDNDTYAVAYSMWDTYSGTSIDFQWKTNNQPSQNSWKVYDEAGNIALQSLPFLVPNTTYTEAFSLPAGCYTLQFYDTGDDGLYYWAAPNNGSGYARMRENMSTRKTFNPEFGRFINYDFWTDGNIIGSEVLNPEHIVVYPNPSSGQFNLEMQGFVDTQVVLEVYDLMGKRVWNATVEPSGQGYQKSVIDLSHCARGNYVLKIWDGHEIKVRDLIKQ